MSISSIVVIFETVVISGILANGMLTLLLLLVTFPVMVNESLISVERNLHFAVRETVRALVTSELLTVRC